LSYKRCKKDLESFIKYNEKLIAKLEASNGDIHKINKLKENVELYEQQLKEFDM
jgi:hypothetical protein